jgi:hypothetical protein
VPQDLLLFCLLPHIAATEPGTVAALVPKLVDVDALTAAVDRAVAARPRAA